MEAFAYHDNELFIEKIPLSKIAEQYRTPCYVYSRASIEKNWHAFNTSFGNVSHRICYAVKANSNIAILNLFARLNSGFDIVSEGELERVIAAGGNPELIVFSGVGKSSKEIRRAIQANIFCFNVESETELNQLNSLALLEKRRINIALRINPNVNALTHPYIATGLNENKFGIDLSIALALTEKIKNLPNVNLIGIGCHIGSQITELKAFLAALDCLIELIEKLKKKDIRLQHINIGGGLGICYQNELPPTINEYISAIRNKLDGYNLEIIVEPGRSLIANAGILLTQVEYLKQTAKKNFAIVDAAMNDLMRPALYNAWQDIIPVTLSSNKNKQTYDIVGPVCESADFLAKERELALNERDLLAICDVGAYGFSMSSNYNSRPRAAEVLVDGNQSHLIRSRESIQDLFRLEKLI